MEEKVSNVDLRALAPPHLRAEPPPDEPPIEAVDEDYESEDESLPGFSTALLALGIAFALVGGARLAWNVYEEWLYGRCSYCGVPWFLFLDRSMSFFEAFGLFVLAAGVWRRR